MNKQPIHLVSPFFQFHQQEKGQKFQNKEKIQKKKKTEPPRKWIYWISYLGNKIRNLLNFCYNRAIFIRPHKKGRNSRGFEHVFLREFLPFSTYFLVFFFFFTFLPI